MGTEPPDEIPQVRARRLVLVDDQGNERIVAEVVDQQALLRVMLAGPGRPQEAVVLYAAPHDGAGDIGPSLGVQLWADGDAHAEINLCKEHGRWTTETFIED